MRSLILSILALIGLTASAAFTKDNFVKSSRLASGNWVKVAIGETGVYEISYEALRNMGFSNPTRVSVFGRGARQYDVNFQSSTRVPLYKDDIQQIPVLNHNEKLYFYALGPEEIKYTVNTSMYDAGASVSRLNNNIYTKQGYYFLTDSADPMEMEKVISTGLSSLDEQADGVGYVYHESDIYHNNTNTGQLYYGEKMTPDNPRLSFKLDLPDAIPGRTASVECVVYADKVKDILLTYGFEGALQSITAKDPAVSSSDFRACSPTLSKLIIPSEAPTFYTEMDFSANGGDPMDISNLDYFIVSYNRRIPTLKASDGSRLAADRIALPRISIGKPKKVRIPNGIDRIVLNTSDPLKPFQMDLYHDGTDGLAKVENQYTCPELVIFDPSMTQKQIKNVEGGAWSVKNQDIHAQAADGADLIIICIPQLKESAEELAEIHRSKLGQRVIVATTEECYNEFSGGMPDPMAYRGLVKMAYSSDYGCRSLLLMGPLYADFRGISVDKNPTEGIIAFQSIVTNTERGGFNVNDFYGLMIDYMGSQNIETLTINVGVGILPVRYPAEAATYIKKVSDYLDRTDHAYYLNHFLSIGGTGDDDLHTSQVPEIDRFINTLGNRTTINTQLAIDAYGFQAAHYKFFHLLDEGVNIVTYYGHGSSTMLNQTGNFFTAPDVFRFRNKVAPIWGFAGCELSQPDKGSRGMGESIVLSTPYGMIGSIISSRETWSSMNLDFFKKFIGNFLRNGGTSSSLPYVNAPTLGQIFANTKTQSSYTNELAYQLIADPGVVIPTVNRYIIPENTEIHAVAGEWLEVSGYVRQHNSAGVEYSYNGEVVMRLMEPYKEISCPHIVLNSQHVDTGSIVVKLTYADTQVAMGVAEVKNGRFKVRLMVPEYAGRFEESVGRLHLCAYDPTSRMGAAAMVGATYKKEEADKESTLSADLVAPVIERLEYDLDSNSLDIRVSDNLALAFDSDPLRAPFRLLIDGKELRLGASTKPMIDREAMAYEKNITLEDIREGSHTAKVIVRDAAGNDASAEIIFEYMPERSPYSIELADAAVDGSGRFVAVNAAPASADIVILAADGTIIHRDAFRNGEYLWDACDSYGNPVAPGLYKAYIIETGDSKRKGHSSLINVPVI